MAYSAIVDGDVDAESPGTTGLFTKLRDNPLEIAQGTSGAPTLPFTRLYYVEEQKAAGTDSATALVDTTAVARRDLVEVVDTLGAAGGGGGSIGGANNTQITLPTGTYWVEASAELAIVADQADFIHVKHRLALYNVTDVAYQLDGVTHVVGFAPSAAGKFGGQTAHLSGEITITAATEVFELRHYMDETSGGNPALYGGEALNWAGHGEIYARIRMWQTTVG